MGRKRDANPSALTVMAMSIRLRDDVELFEFAAILKANGGASFNSEATLRAIDFPGRQIHLDFHTGPDIPDVGAEFDVRQFVQTMQRANVNSVTVFAKCHHGHLYYDTKHPARHPGLKKNLDLLGKQVEGLHRAGIRAPIYISVQCDEFAANTHPEWVARKEDTSQAKSGSVFKPGWQVLDMATDYQDYLAEQTLEILKLFKPVDGLFFDMCWDQPSTTAPFMAQMRRAKLDPESEADRKVYAHRVALAYMKRFSQMVKDYSPSGTYYFNSRPLGNLKEEIPYLAQVEIEALPTGGWGYMYFPKNVRFARNFPRPYLGMTARFHKSWADFGGLKPYPALEYETSQMMAHGAKCSVGDQMHPRGTLDKGAYDLIGKVYARVKAREPWLTNARAVTEIGVLQPASAPSLRASGAIEGAVRMLTQLKHQFDILTNDADFTKYSLLILPDTVDVDAELNKKLESYLKAGNSLLFTGHSGLSTDGTKLQFKALGIKPVGPSPFTTTYLRFDGAIATDVPDSDHVMYESGVRVLAQKGTRTFGRVVEPYFNRRWDHFCSHNQTPGDKASIYPIATLHGKVGYVPFPIFSAFGKHGNYPYRLLVRNLLNLLLPEPLVRASAPTSTEVTVTSRPEQTIIHLLQYCPERRAENLDLLEDIVPLHNVAMSVRRSKKPRKVYLAPDETPLPFEYTSGRVNTVIPVVAGHAMLVIE